MLEHRRNGVNGLVISGTPHTVYMNVIKHHILNNIELYSMCAPVFMASVIRVLVIEADIKINTAGIRDPS